MFNSYVKLPEGTFIAIQRIQSTPFELKNGVPMGTCQDIRRSHFVGARWTTGFREKFLQIRRPLEKNGDHTFPEAFLKRRRNLGRVSKKTWDETDETRSLISSMAISGISPQHMDLYGTIPPFLDPVYFPLISWPWELPGGAMTSPILWSHPPWRYGPGINHSRNTLQRLLHPVVPLIFDTWIWRFLKLGYPKSSIQTGCSMK